MKNLYTLDSVSKFYVSNDIVNVGIRRVSLNFNLGEIVAITGQSGSGKSTLVNILGGIDTYDEGFVSYDGEDISHYTVKDYEQFRAENIGFIFQNYNIIDSYTVFQNVLLALEIQNYPKRDRKKRALELIDLVGLSSHKNHKAAKLSGGQKQRCVIARALAKDAKIIIADEPTGNLDRESSLQIIDLIKKVASDKLVIIVTHDYDLIKNIATRRIKMFDGEIIEDKMVQTPAITTQASQPPNTSKMSMATIFKFALRNLLSTPKKFIFNVFLHTTIIFFFTMVFILISNAFSDAIRFDIPSYNYEKFGDVYFANTPDNRFFIAKQDGSDFTNTEINELNQNSHGAYVYAQLPWIDTFLPDFILLDNPHTVYDNRIYAVSERPGIFDSTYSISDKQQFLSGSMPINFNQVVVSKALDLPVGSHISMDRSEFLEYEIRIEVDNQGNLVFLYPEGVDYNDLAYLSADIYLDLNTSETQAYYLPYFYQVTSESINQNFGITEADYERIVIFATGVTSQTHEFVVVGVFDDLSTRKIYFHHESLINQASTSSQKNLLSVVAKSNQSAYNYFQSINKDQYRVIYPRLEISATDRILNPINFVILMIGYVIIFIIGILMYLLLYAVLRNLMRSKMKDFAIYRSIGATKQNLGLLVIFELLCVGMIALVIAIGLVYFYGYNDRSMNAMLESFTFGDFLVLVLIVMILSLRLSLRFNKRIFKFSIIDNIASGKVAL